MAITLHGTTGVNASKSGAPSSTGTLSISGIATGDWVLLIYTDDNDGISPIAAPVVTNSATSNDWYGETVQYAGSDPVTSNNTYPQVSCILGQVQTVNSANNFSYNLTFDPGSVISRYAMGAYVFRCTAGETLILDGYSEQEQSNTAIGPLFQYPGSTGGRIGDLTFGIAGIYGPTTETITYDTDTVDGTWTSGYGGGTSGGSAAGNMKFGSQYKVVTANDSSNTWALTLSNSRYGAELLFRIQSPVVGNLAVSPTPAATATGSFSKSAATTVSPTTAAVGAVTRFPKATTSAATSSNFITNGSFESDMAGWTTNATYASFNRNNSSPYVGSWNGWLFAQTANSPLAVTTASVTGLTVGKKYRASAWVKNASGTAGFRIVASPGTAGTDITPSSTWQQATVEWIATNSTTSIELGLRGTFGTGEGVYVDDVRVEEWGISPIAIAAGTTSVEHLGSAALLVNITEAGTGGRTQLLSGSLLVGPTNLTEAAAGFVTEFGSATLLVGPTNITEAAAGFVTDLGSAALLVNPTEAGAGTKSIPATAHDVISTTDMVETATLGAKSISTTALEVLSTTEIVEAASLSAIARTGSGALLVDPTEAAAGQPWTTKYLRPDALLVETGLSGPVANIQDSPTSPDGTYLTPTGGAIDVRMSFEDNAADMRTGTGDQIIRVLVTAV